MSTFTYKVTIVTPDERRDDPVIPQPDPASEGAVTYELERALDESAIGGYGWEAEVSLISSGNPDLST